jgi:tetratricopeptide (TPR) repeat protein
MRRLLMAALAVWLLRPAVLLAGVYNSESPIQGPLAADGTVKALPATFFRDILLLDLKNLAIQQPAGTMRQDYVKRRDALQAKVRAGQATVEDRLNLGAYLIRLREWDAAVNELTVAAVQDRRDFRVLATLATAHQLAGRLQRALDYLEDALAVWPTEYPGWTKEQLAWYRRAETYQRTLLRLRYRESLRPAAGPPADKQSPKALPGIDALFPVRFVGESGSYEAGQLAAAERNKLPADAVPIVQQLLIWLPEDPRLYWLYGELLNAQGDIGSAAKILSECVWKGSIDSPELRAHRVVLEAAKPKVEGPLLEAAPEPPDTAPPPRPSYLPEGKKLLLVGIGAGLLIAALAYFQIRELGRRRQRGRPTSES